MIYGTYTIGGELMHAHTREWSKPTKYIEKKKTKSGKWRYIYPDTYKNEGNRYYKKATTKRNYKKGKELGLISDISASGKDIAGTVNKVLDKISTKKSKSYVPEQEIVPLHDVENSNDKIFKTKSRIYIPEQELGEDKKDKEKKRSIFDKIFTNKSENTKSEIVGDVHFSPDRSVSELYKKKRKKK